MAYAGGLVIESVTLLAVAAARATRRRLPPDLALPVMVGAIQLAFVIGTLRRGRKGAPT